MDPSATYDIETQDWTTFVVGAIHYKKGPAAGQTEVFREARALAEALLRIDGEVYAHNGSRFDHLWLMDELGLPAAVVPNASGMIELRFPGSKARFLDSMRVFPFSLRKLTNGGKGKLDDLCRCSPPVGWRPTAEKPKYTCGGYCAIRLDMSRGVRAKVEEYLVGDVEELSRALDDMQSLADAVGFSIKRTVGSTAWAHASEFLGLPPHQYDRATWARVREGYHGGRAEVFRRWSDAGHLCDVNSMYGWSLCEPVPVGFPTVREGRSALAALVRQLPGVYRVTIDVPEQWIPPLPYSTPKGLSFPCGRFTGSWPLPEILYAVERCEARIPFVHSAVTFDREERVFTPWVERMFAERMRWGKKTREGEWLKFLINSLTGKLGFRCETRRLRVYPDYHSIRLCSCQAGMACQCGGWRPLDRRGKVWEQKILTRTPAPCAHPEWSSYVTARPRMLLHQQLTWNPDDAVYCDTDSVWSENERPGLGPELGGFSDEGVYREFEALGPKAYHAMVCKPGKPEEEVLRLKGVPTKDAYRKWEEIRAGVPQVFPSFRGIKRAAGGNFFVRDEQKRRITANTGRRVIASDDDPKTYPPCIVNQE